MPRRPYICYALTELSPKFREQAKAFYVRAGDTCAEIYGSEQRGFVPHEHYDPQKHKDFTPAQVDAAERRQVTQNTSLVIVIALEPSWGGGIEVEMARSAGVPIILICEKAKLEARLISRLLRGNPAVQEVIEFEDFDDAIQQLEEVLRQSSPAYWWWQRLSNRLRWWWLRR